MAATRSTSTGAPVEKNNSQGAGLKRFSAVRECLQKNGVTLPKRTPGSGRPDGPGAFGGPDRGPVLPKGVTRAQFEAALKKCGGRSFGRGLGGPNGSGPRTFDPRFRQSLAKFAACLRQNGVDVPAPNTSGKGPIFSTKGLNTKSPQFRAATTKCRGALAGTFRRPGPPAPQS